MEGVLELARQSSSESGAGIVKGTQSGGSITYMVRSMFCFASIGVAAVKKADTSRISVLSLRKDNNPAQFDAVKALWRVTAASPAYCSRFRARAVRNAITTRANAEVFSEAAVAFTGDKRSADQVGTLLAGAFSLTSSKLISLNAAVAWLEKQDWSGFRVEAIDSDENQCLAHLLSSPIRVERQFGSETITLDEAIERARMEATPGPDGLAMLRIGVHVGRESVHIANNHQGLERIFANTPWSGAKWRGQLLRVEGALTPKNPVRFGPSVLQRAVTIPI
jgi:putative DNA primase/helicase